MRRLTTLVMVLVLMIVLTGTVNAKIVRLPQVEAAKAAMANNATGDSGGKIVLYVAGGILLAGGVVWAVSALSRDKDSSNHGFLTRMHPVAGVNTIRYTGFLAQQWRPRGR